MLISSNDVIANSFYDVWFTTSSLANIVRKTKKWSKLKSENIDVPNDFDSNISVKKTVHYIIQQIYIENMEFISAHFSNILQFILIAVRKYWLHHYLYIMMTNDNFIAGRYTLNLSIVFFKNLQIVLKKTENNEYSFLS